jgi:hypothetical protein
LVTGAIDAAVEFGGIERLIGLLKLFVGVGGELIRVEQTLIKGLRGFILPVDLAADAAFGLQLDRWLKEIFREHQIAVEGVEPIDLWLSVEAAMANDLANVGAVALFHPGIVVFV